MASQRSGKTYHSAAQKAEMEAAEEADKERTRPRRRRLPPPRFSDLFIKKKKEWEEKSLEQSKENIGFFNTGAKVETMFNHSKVSRKPLGSNSILVNSTNSVPSFSDTFDKIFKPSCGTQPQMPMYLCSSTSSFEGHPDNTSGVLFKSLLSTASNLPTDASSGWDSGVGNCGSHPCQNNHDVQPEKESNNSPVKKSAQVGYSPDLFASSDQIIGVENVSSESTPPQPKPKTKTLKPKTRRKQSLYRKWAARSTKPKLPPETHTTSNTSTAHFVTDAPIGEPPISQSPPPQVQPSPLVQRFLNSMGIMCTPLHQSRQLGSPSSLVSQLKIKSGTTPVTGKSGGKSSVHTSTPTEQSKWSVHGSSSLDIRVSPVPREEEVVTDNSSVFQSPTPPPERNREQSQRDLGGSPSLLSKYETCMSSGRFKEDTNQQYVTGETCDSEKDESPKDDGNSIKITEGMLKGTKIPKITFESPSQLESTSQATDSATDKMLFSDYEASVIITKRTRVGKAAKTLESSQSFSTTHSPKVFITRRNGQPLSPWLAKKFSPKLTRSRSRLLGQQSDESHSTDLSHFGSSITSCASEDQISWDSKSIGRRKNIKRENMRRKKSTRIASQEAKSCVDTDESTMDFLPPPEKSQTLVRRRTQGKTIACRGSGRSSQGPPPVARRSVRLSNKRKPVKVSLLKGRHSKVRTHDHSTSRASSQAEASTNNISSDCSSIINFRPRRNRRNNQFIFHRASPYQSSTIISVDSSKDGSLTEPPVPTTSNQHTGDRTGKLEDTCMNPDLHSGAEESIGPASCHLRKISEGDEECRMKEAVVMLTRLEEKESSTGENVSVLSNLLTLPAKPGKGWRRSIAIRARASSLASAEDVFAMPPPSLPSRSLGCYRKISGLRISSFPLELNHQHHHLPTTNPTDSPRRPVLQMSFCTEEAELSAQAAPPTDPRQQVLELCSQEEPLPLTHCFTDSRLACCRKIGEGVYGEVFMTRPNPASLEGATVLKVMPIEGNFLVNGEPQKKFDEILSEMVISMELSKLRAPERVSSMTQNFVHVQGSWCVEGRYPHDLLHLWDLYNEEKNSENDRPDLFPDTQLYVVLEFAHAGCDLEGYVFNNARDLMAVFLQIAYSLAVAEEALEFEHRDLHWGNVLVAQTTQAKMDFKLGGETYTLNTHGLKATVIDFTLSRMKLPNCIVFNNLAVDPSLFTSEGDYQFEVYRQMQQTNNNTWETFKPYTNVLWLHYLLVKMTSQCYIKNNKTKVHRTHHVLLTKLKDAMLTYESALHFVHSREAQE